MKRLQWKSIKAYQGWIISGCIVLLVIWLACPFSVLRLKSHNPKRTRLMDLRQAYAEQHQRKYSIHSHWVPLDRIAKPMQQAVVAAEDGNFYTHAGLDFNEIWRSAKTNLKRKRYAFGGSTITQQVAKNLFLSPRKTILRKIREAILALELDLFLGKKRVLELYLNSAEWGKGVFGVEAAAQTYFNKSAAELTLEEAVDLAAVLPSPLHHSPMVEDRYLIWRRALIRQHMELPENTEAQALTLTAEPGAVTSTAVADMEAAEILAEQAEIIGLPEVPGNSLTSAGEP